MKNMNSYLYQLRITNKISGAKFVLLIIYSNFTAKIFSIEALPFELHLMFVMVRTATYSDTQPAKSSARMSAADQSGEVSKVCSSAVRRRILLHTHPKAEAVHAAIYHLSET